MFTPLQIASQFGNHEVVKRLLDSRNDFQFSVDVNAYGCTFYSEAKTALHYACRYNNPLTVRALLQHPNIEVNKVDGNNFTPLQTACQKQCLDKEIIMELLKHPDIHLTEKDSDGRIPLHHACQKIKEDNDIIKLLIGHQEQKHRMIQLNTTDNKLQTPLHVACALNKGIIVVYLLEHANVIDINVKDKFVQTPLCIACSTPFMNSETVCIINTLLEQRSVLIHKKNNDGKLPLEFIQQRLDNLIWKNQVQKPYLMLILQLFDDYHMRQRCLMITICDFRKIMITA